MYATVIADSSLSEVYANQVKGRRKNKSVYVYEYI